MIDAVLRRRKGQNISADFAIAMGLFVVTIAVAIFYVSSILTPASPFSTQLETSAVQAAQSLQRQGAWTVHQTPVTVDVPAGVGSVSGFPFVVRSAIPDDAVTDSWGVRQGDRLLPFHVNQSRDTVAFVTTVDDPVERFMVAYHEDGSFLPATQQTTMTATTGSVDTGDITFDWESDGISGLTRDGTSYITDLTMGSGLETYLSNVTARGAFPDGDLTAFTDSPIIYIDPDGAQTIEMTLPGALDAMNDSGANDGDLSASNVEWADVTSGSRGLLIAGDLTSVSGTDSGDSVSLTVDTADQRMLLLPHSGDPTAADDERSLFLDAAIHTLPRRPITGLSRQRIEDVRTGATEDLLGLRDLGYNITVNATPPIGLGSTPETDDSRSVYDSPVILLDRFGRANLTTLEVMVWL